MRMFEKEAERKIQDAIAKGELDNYKGKGISLLPEIRLIARKCCAVKNEGTIFKKMDVDIISLPSDFVLVSKLHKS